MKKRLLLIDESLTVQKVVALTLDRERFTVANAKSRSEAMKVVLEAPPDLILVSDQVTGLTAASFPKEVETWVGRDRRIPPLVLITGQELKEQRGYRAVLKKPFAPQALQNIVNEALADAPGTSGEDSDDRMQRVFNDAFSDEAGLVSETLRTEVDESEDTLLTIPAPSREGGAKTGRRSPPPVESVAELWGKTEAPEPGGVVQVLGADDSMAYKAQLEKEVRRQLESHDLEDIVHRLLEKLVPPIVERLAQQRLDQLLKESENFVELKP